MLDYRIRYGAGQRSYGIELAEAMGLGSKQLEGLIRDKIQNRELPPDITRIN